MPTAEERQILRTPPSSANHALPTRSARQTPDKTTTTTTTPTKKDHQRFVLTDFAASRYLAEDPSTTVLEQGVQLPGYECYVVEQWVVSRTDPTFMITTYSGNPSHTVTVDVLSVPSDEKTWSPRLRIFFKALNQYNARREMTPLGTLMITNLSGFPSYLTVIPVPDGNVMAHRLHFFINEDLKRLGCLGRVGLTLGPAQPSAIAKFYQIYQTSEKTDVEESIVQLVRFCQLALYMFNKLDVEFTDGLLCDVTELAISRWWNEIGAEHYGVEPHDGALGPTTVAALLGLFMGARNRLRSFGVTVPKDPFDLEAMKRGIAIFQKQQRIPKSRRLDRATLNLLIKATAKAAAGDGWAVPKAVKSTVAELSGRGGEMLNDVVRKRDRSGIAEIETTDYDRFIHLAYGAHARWLWHGKAMKGTFVSTLSRHRAFKVSEKDTKQSIAKDAESPRTPGIDSDGSLVEEHTSRLMKRATDLRNEAKSGLGRFRHAVHLGQRQDTSPKQDQERSPQSVPRTSLDEPPKSDYSSPGSPFSGPTSPMSPATQRMPEFSLNRDPVSTHSKYHDESQPHSRNQSPRPKHSPALIIPTSTHDQVDDRTINQQAPTGNEVRSARAKTGLHFDKHDLSLPGDVDAHNEITTDLRRTISDPDPFAFRTSIERPGLFPRYLSFTLAEDTVLTRSEGDLSSSDGSITGDDNVYAVEEYKAERQKDLAAAIKELQNDASTWTEEQLTSLQKLVERTGFHQQDAEESYRPRDEAFQSLTTNIDTMLRDEKEHLEEGNKELETLSARLKYEIDGLRGRIEDVDQVVDDFENAVQRVEDRVAELEKDDAGRRGIRCTIM